MFIIADIDANKIMGMTVNAAHNYATEHGWGFRIASHNNTRFNLTKDERSDRVTVDIENGLVTRVEVR